MRDTILTAALTFSLLAGGTAAIGNELVRAKAAPAASTEVVVLPTVTVTGQRMAKTDVVMLPTVTVTGRKVAPTQLAADTAATPATRVE